MIDAERAESLVGTVLVGQSSREQRFRIDSVMGPGETGAWVFRGSALDSEQSPVGDRQGQSVAIRCPGIPSNLGGVEYEAALDRFLVEANHLARISGTGSDLEQLLAWGIAEPKGQARLPFCVFEWLAGKSLEQLIREREGALLSISEALAILEPAARGLATAHALGITHRDVRPRNIWLVKTGQHTRLKVTQFALASRIGPSTEAPAPAFAAPEQFKRSYGAIGPQTDVYGLALCLVELVTGKRALVGSDAAELYLATSDLARRPTPRMHGVQVSDAVEAVLSRALAVDPKRRWQNARELWDALVAAVPELTPAVPSVRPAQAEVTEEAPSSLTPSVPSIWAARDPSRAVVVPAEDARLGESSKVASFVPKAPPTRGRTNTSLRAWALVGILAVVAVVVVRSRIGSSPPSPPVASVPSAPPEPKAAIPLAPRTVTSAAAVQSDEPAVRFQAFLTDMLRVPAGTFTMGSDRDGRGDGPSHRVTITKAYYIDRTEVTAEAYAACIEEGACTANRVHPLAKTAENDGVDPSWGCNTVKDHPRHPVNCVDHDQAERFCAYAQKRLPTEAEWEYAARGPDKRDWPWGNTAPTTCAMAVLSGMTGECRDRKGTSEVGGTTEGRSPFGALDMAGNVWEWVADGYQAYASTDQSDPKVPLGSPWAKGVLRGGSWDYAPTSAKTIFRFPLMANIGNLTSGFRCARDAND